MRKIAATSLYTTLLLLATSSTSSASGGSWGEGLALLGFLFFTTIQITATVAYFLFLRLLKKYKLARNILHSLFGVISLFYLYLLSGYAYGMFFHVADKGIIGSLTYLFFIYCFVLVLFSFKWSQNNVHRLVYSRTLTMLYIVLFFTWLLSPRIPTHFVMKNYWSPPFGSGLWGALNVNHFVFNPLTVSGLFALVVWAFYRINKLLYFPNDRISAGIINNKHLIQGTACVIFSALLMAAFEPSLSGPVPKLFVYPKILFKASSDIAQESVRWSGYYGSSLTSDDVSKHVQYTDALMWRANQRVVDGDYEHALSDLTTIPQIIFERKNLGYYMGTGPVPYYDRLSWLLSTCPDGKVRDGKRAMEYALKAINAYGVDIIGLPNDQLVAEQKKYQDWRKDPLMSASLLQVLSAAYAETGEFDKAHAGLEKAVDLLNVSNPNWYISEKSLLANQMTVYENHQPWHDILRSNGPVFSEPRL